MTEQCSLPLQIQFKVSKSSTNIDQLVPTKCTNCSFQAITNLLFLKHLVNDDKQCHEWKCHQCAYIFFPTQRSYRHHKTYYHSAKKFNCGYCDFVAKTKSDQKRHLAASHSTEADKEKWFQCKLCDYKNYDKLRIQDHMDTRHFDKDNATWMKCPCCRYKTNIEKYLKRHMDYQHSKKYKSKCEICDIWVGKYHLKHHIATMHEKNAEEYKCEFCRKSFKWKSSLDNHIKRQHTSIREKEWQKCESCDYKTLYKHELVLHIRQHHKTSAPHVQSDVEKKGDVKEKPWFRCTDCDAKFRQKFNLKSHVLRKHKVDENGQLIRCPHCDFAHIHQGTMNFHIKRRHDKKEVKCQYCGRMCFNEEALKNHIRNLKHNVKVAQLTEET